MSRVSGGSMLPAITETWSLALNHFFFGVSRIRGRSVCGSERVCEACRDEKIKRLSLRTIKQNPGRHTWGGPPPGALRQEHCRTSRTRQTCTRLNLSNVTHHQLVLESWQHILTFLHDIFFLKRRIRQTRFLLLLCEALNPSSYIYNSSSSSSTLYILFFISMCSLVLTHAAH